MFLYVENSKQLLGLQNYLGLQHFSTTFVFVWVFPMVLTFC